MPLPQAASRPLITSVEEPATRITHKEMAWLLLAAFLFCCLATPLNLVHGFLFAEEGTVYLRYAWLASPYQALFAPHQQYFALFPNVVALIEARLLPLIWAAVFSAWMVLLAHLWAVFMVASCERFTQRATRLLAVAIVLLGPGAIPTMVGSTQTQFLFGLVCLSIMLSDPEQHSASRTVSVALGGLNGVVSCMLTPFFLYRAWRTRSTTAWLQASILCVCTAVQALVLHHALPYASRGSIAHRSIAAFIDVVSNHMLVLPFLTRVAYHTVAVHGHAPGGVWLAFALFSLAAFTLVCRSVWFAGVLPRALVLIGLFHACLAAVGMEGQASEVLGGGERYFVVGNAAIAFALLLQWQTDRASSAASRLRPATVLLALLLLSGCADAARFWKLNQSGPVWKPQIQAWQTDPTHVTLSVNPSTCPMYLAPRKASLDLPFYIFDSNTRADALDGLPSRWFGPDPTGPEHTGGPVFTPYLWPCTPQSISR